MYSDKKIGIFRCYKIELKTNKKCRKRKTLYLKGQSIKRGNPFGGEQVLRLRDGPAENILRDNEKQEEGNVERE